MRRMLSTTLTAAAVLLQLLPLVAGHGHGNSNTGMDMGMDMNKASALAHNTTSTANDAWSLPSYAGLPEQPSSMLGHVVLMVLAWFFVLPIGIMFSISRSKLALPTQLVFLVLNGLGVAFGISYNVKTPDLYENNAHHKIGWIATWVMIAQVVMSLIFIYSGRRKIERVAKSEQAAFLTVSVGAMAQHDMRMHSNYRWSGDSGQGTERSSMHTSRDVSPTNPSRRDSLGTYSKPEAESDEEDDEQEPMPQPRGWLRNNVIDRFLSQRLPGMFSKRLLKIFDLLYISIDRTILVLGFISFLTGGVTYAGIFRANTVFSGLAHFIKGGIFFWYGLLTLGRWMGCFAEFGWAWNVKPTRTEVGWKASIPSAEFTESFVIWLYGNTNVFLEHLAAWGDAWSPQDLEHVAISVMFFGGGLCGMLIESTTVRKWLNTQIEMMPERHELPPSEAQVTRQPPKTYDHPLNVLPGLIILLLGVMMSSHQQESMVSTMVHAQWGSLLVGFSLARGVTYIMTYISPPTSVYASRPPSELIASFCLIAGGIIFMGSASDIVRLMEDNNLHAMFLFTITMGFSAFLMAWTILVLALKGWATRQEHRALTSRIY